MEKAMLQAVKADGDFDRQTRMEELIRDARCFAHCLSVSIGQDEVGDRDAIERQHTLAIKIGDRVEELYCVFHDRHAL
jgi:hypothetical protein